MDAPSGNLQGDDNDLVTPRVNSGLNLEGNLQGDDNELVTPRVNSGLNLNLEGGKDDIEAQIHLLEQEAYCSVLRAFKAQADSISLGKETLINELRKELRVSSEEQRELLARVDSNTVIRGIRDWRQSGGHQPGMLVAGQSVHDPIPSQGAGPSSTLHPPSVSAANQPSSSLAKRGPMLEQKGKKHKSGQMDEPTFMGVDPNGGDDSVLLDVPGNLCTYRMEGQLINTPPQSVTPHQSAPPLLPQPAPPLLPQPAPPLLPQPAIQVPRAVASLFEQAVFQHIISKRLHHSDVVAGKARFSMPQNQILQQDFLCKSELDLLGKDSLKIEMFFSGDRSYVVDLKLYRSGKSQNRTKVLMGSAWRSLVNDYNLKVGDSVELWKGSKDGTTRYIIKKV